MDGDPDNNQMESFNGNTFRMREKAVRGLKSEDPAIPAGLQVCHNHVRPHPAPDGRMPGEAPASTSTAEASCSRSRRPPNSPRGFRPDPLGRQSSSGQGFGGPTPRRVFA